MAHPADPRPGQTDPVWYMIADYAFKRSGVRYRDRQTFIEGCVAGLEEAHATGLLTDLFATVNS